MDGFSPAVSSAWDSLDMAVGGRGPAVETADGCSRARTGRSEADHMWDRCACMQGESGASVRQEFAVTNVLLPLGSFAQLLSWAQGNHGLDAPDFNAT